MKTATYAFTQPDSQTYILYPVFANTIVGSNLFVLPGLVT